MPGLFEIYYQRYELTLSYWRKKETFVPLSYEECKAFLPPKKKSQIK